jgi:hypothetical protein
MNPLSTIATAVVTLLTEFVALMPTASVGQVGTVISTLIQIIPVVVQEASDLVAPIKNIIVALKSNSAITPEQMANLAILDAQCDAEFEAAAADAGIPPDNTAP